MYPHLKKAPAVEAVFDIRISCQKPIAIDSLDEAHTRIRDRYPKKKIKRVFQFSATLPKSAEVGQGQFGGNEEIDGFHFISEDEKQIVQYRKSGFTFSRLRPYTNWESVKREALELWNFYREIIGSFVVTRVALRYINRIDLGFSDREFERMFKIEPSYPIVPNVTHGPFVNNITLNNASKGLQAHYIFAKENGTPNSSHETFILDIDAFKSMSTTADTEIITAFEDLRSYKNDLFFASFTKAGIASFK